MKVLKVFLLIALTSIAQSFAAPTDSSTVQSYILIKPVKTEFAYGTEELAKSAALYKAVEEASFYKAMAEAASELSLNKSAENYLKALSKLKKFWISKQYADMAYNLASVYLKQKKYDDAAKYLLKSSISYDTVGLKTVAGSTYIKLANIKFEQKKYKEAEELIMKKGYPLCGPADNLACYQLLAKLYHEQSRFSEAKWYYLQANTLSRKLQDTTSIITSLTALGKVKIAIKQYALALKDLDEAETLAQTDDFSVLLPEIKLAQQIIQTKAPKLFAARTTETKPIAQSNDAYPTAVIFASDK